MDQYPLYLTSPVNIRYLTGFNGSSSACLLAKNKIYLFTDQRYFAEISRKAIPPPILKQKINVIDITADFIKPFRKILQENRLKTLFFEENYLTVSDLKKLRKLVKGLKINLKPALNVIEDLRSQKTNLEIAKITKAQKIAEQVLKQIKNHFKPGISETALAWKIESMGRELGAEAVSFAPLVCFGQNSATAHHEPQSHRFLKKGDIILLDFGFKYQGYCSDMTRTFFASPPTSLQTKVYQTVLAAQLKAISEIKPGQSSLKADSIARNIIKKAGFGDQFTHSLGHGVGLDIHELPNLSPRFKRKPSSILRENMVVTIEPGIYLEGKFGIRIEDMIVIKKGENINLTTAPKNIAKAFIKL